MTVVWAREVEEEDGLGLLRMDCLWEGGKGAESYLVCVTRWVMGPSL